jgi:hypothetical protein
LSEELESIGDYSFQSCKALTSIEIPAKVTVIGEYAFGSSGISNFIMHPMVPPILGNTALSTDKYTSLVIKVPAASLNTYKISFPFIEGGFTKVY